MQWFRMMMLGTVLAFSVVGCTSDEASQPAAADSAAAESQAVEPVPAEPAADQGVATTPVIDSVRVVPAEPATGDRLEAQVEAGDADLLFEYRWFVDGQHLTGEYQSALGGSHVRRGRSIHVEVTPVRDGSTGAPVAASSITVQNSPPEITNVNTVSFEAGQLVLQVEANDIDGDTLQYELKSSPDGMEIDSNGRIQWTLPEGGASADYTVVVSDGEREFEFEQTLGFEKQQIE